MNFLETLKEYKANGLLVSQLHPTLPLTIWNYSRTTEYERNWDGITIQCRGLITDNITGEIVARPFTKFWNMEEARHTPTKEFEVFDKMDGSMIILFWYKDQWVITSKGSFISEQANVAREMLLKKDLTQLNKDFTYIWEVLYNANRIVVKYNFEDIILLAAFNTKLGTELEYNVLKNYSTFFNVVNRYDGITDYTVLKTLVDDNAEGFVIRFSNGSRMKIKGEEYFRLHKIMTNVSTKSVWEYMKDGSSMDELLDNVPDEFFYIITNYIKVLTAEYEAVYTEILDLFNGYFENKEYISYTPAEYSKFVNTHRTEYKAVLWRMYYGREYSGLIWKIIKPAFRKL